MRRLLSALVRIALAPEAPEAGAWRAEAASAQRAFGQAAEQVDGRRLDSLWTMAVGAAERDPVVRRDETVNPTLPAMSPIGVDRLAAEPFDLDGAVQIIREAASFG